MTKYRLTMDAQGRLTLPEDLRASLGLRPGEAVIVDLEDGAARIHAARHAMDEALRLVRPYRTPGQSVVDELLHDRRGAGD